MRKIKIAKEEKKVKALEKISSEKTIHEILMERYSPEIAKRLDEIDKLYPNIAEIFND